MRRLVWIPKGASAALSGPDPLEIVEFPADPGSDPRLAEVEMLVAPPRTPAFDVTMQFGQLWGRMDSLRVVQVLTAGVDWIVGSLPPGIQLCSARGAHDAPVSEWVMAAILAGLKDLVCFHDEQREGLWLPRMTGGLDTSKVLILGYGSIGRAVETKLRPFGPTITKIARTPRAGVLSAEALAGVLPESDVVVVLLPLTPKTAGIVDASLLAQMKPGALLVNAARGRLVETQALLDALNERRVRAVLDVTDPEPLPADHPLRYAPGVLVTPHVAGSTPGWLDRVYELVRVQLGRFARGEPLANVVGEEGY